MHRIEEHYFCASKTWLTRLPSSAAMIPRMCRKGSIRAEPFGTSQPLDVHSRRFAIPSQFH
jgi:hypothetical protein